MTTLHRVPLILGAIALFVPSTARAANSPFDVGNRAQLFVDRVLVQDADGVAFTLHPGKKHPDNPLVKVDRPWEGWRLEIYGCVIYDEQEKLFKMWYMCDSPADFPHYATLYATSQDGIHWEKPLVSVVPSLRGGETNAVVDGVLLASVIKDVDDSDPARRYKMICWRLKEPRGYQTMVSPDGLHWTQVGEEPICRDADVITGFYDPGRRQYVAFPKIYTKILGFDRRCFSVITSDDFLHWSEPQLAFAPDLRDDAGSLTRIERIRHRLDVPDDPQMMRTEFYGISVYPHESCTLAFPWVFTINNLCRYGNHEGPAEIQLAASRDLVHWERPLRNPVIAMYEPGAWDESYQQASASAIRVGDEVWLYYAGANYTHGTPCLYVPEGTGRLTQYTSSIGLVTWKLDRFVSVDGPAEGGSLTTVPVAFAGQRLEINATTGPQGRIVVEILDPAGKPIEGFARSDALIGDSVRHAVTFGGTGDVSPLAGKPIVLRFDLTDASLFSFAFRD